VIGAIPLASGLYRIHGRDETIVYVGEGALRTRLAAHAAKLTTSSAQGRVLTNAAPLDYSTVAGRWARHERLELETDLIAACVLAARRPPPAQFIG
jgi:excinuclease UvrABC nuclease subunit